MTTPKRKRPTRRAATKAAPTPSATIVSNGDDWEGLYINGALVAEDHRLDPHVILTALGVSIKRVDVSGDWLGGEDHDFYYDWQDWRDGEPEMVPHDWWPAHREDTPACEWTNDALQFIPPGFRGECENSYSFDGTDEEAIERLRAAGFETMKTPEEDEPS